MAIKSSLAAGFALALSATPLMAGSKDETMAEWLPAKPNWFNDWREKLANKGFSFSATYILDNIGNVSGGMRQGAIHLGRFDLGVDADLEKLSGWTGAKLHANMYESHGRGLSRDYVGNLATVSETEALPDTRLYEANIEQTLLNGALAVKFGQQAADVEFFDSETDDLFINSTFGWPAIKATNLPAGGPSPPIAALGVRVKAKLSEDITAFAAVFNGNAAKPGAGDPQLRDNHGLAFRLTDAPWVIGQVRWDYDLGFGGRTLPGNINPGGWDPFGTFDDQRFTATGSSLADPSGSGIAAKLRGDYGLFATIEQTLYRPASVTAKGVSASLPRAPAFARIAYTPPHPNLIHLYADGGIGVSGLVPGRPGDRFGVGIAYMHISRAAQSLDRDTHFFTSLPTPVRSNDTVLEVIYAAHSKPGLLMAPFFQYIFRPSGGAANPLDPTGLAPLRDAAIFGLTTTLKY